MSFRVGQRVIFQDLLHPIKSYFHATSTGIWGMVMHLNATDELGNIKPITGRVIKVNTDINENVYIDIRPDGWPFSETVWPGGFQISAKYLKPYPKDGQEMPGTITDELGRVLSKEEIAELVGKRLSAIRDQPLE